MNDVKQIFGVGIIGCGFIGQKRAKALGAGGRLIACADVDFSKATKLAQIYGAKAFESWHDLLQI
jgi:predicted dehydrogenase